jgi:AcrR family transcriptional regulator
MVMAKKRPGPPKAFDIDTALMAAMFVFWQKGFDGASLTDLTKAMGINRPSLYGTFGDKQSLFRRAVDRYTQKGLPVYLESDAEATARGFVERFLRGQADLYTDPNLPPGCFLIQSSLSTRTSSQAARRMTSERRRLNEMAVRQRLARAGKDELPPGVMPEQLAAYVASVGYGLAIRAADGAKREELYRIIELALTFWPKTMDRSTARIKRFTALPSKNFHATSMRMPTSGATPKKR